jgi:photosystem II stability/assembly factor-like uncharacterized protein
MNGWVERLHELGNIAGGYGSRNSYLADWATITHIPNDVWVASWYTNTYDPAASVYGISWLNGLWVNHQRFRQYAGGHNETWGSIKFNIDSNVADGVVAMPSSKLLSNPVIPKTIPIQDTGWLSADQGWLIQGDTLYWTDDQGKNWQDISPGSVQRAYFLPSGDAWALSSTDQEPLSLYHSLNGGDSWEIINFPLPVDGTWTPLQLQFTSPTSGWVVLQRQTSQAFDSGILMKTSDGGRTWQEYDLPSAAPIRYISGQEGWLTGRNGDKYYHTIDSGATWQAAMPDQYPKSIARLPDGTTLSGWQADDLGWAVTSAGNCSGEKSSPDFTCRIDTVLQQSKDGGLTWQELSLPTQE